jgi:hypothetical protein
VSFVFVFVKACLKFSDEKIRVLIMSQADSMRFIIKFRMSEIL